MGHFYLFFISRVSCISLCSVVLLHFQTWATYFNSPVLYCSPFIQLISKPCLEVFIFPFLTPYFSKCQALGRPIFPNQASKRQLWIVLTQVVTRRGRGPQKRGALLLQEGADGHLPDGRQPRLTNCNICTLNCISEDGPDTDCRSLPTAPGHTAAPRARAFCKMQNDKPEKRLRLIKVCSGARLKESSKVDVREKSILNICILNVSPNPTFCPQPQTCLAFHMAPCKPGIKMWTMQTQPTLMVLLPGHSTAESEVLFQLPDQKSLRALQEHSEMD